MARKADLPSPFQVKLPKGLGVGKDRLLLRLDFYSEGIVLQDVEKKGGAFRMISAYDMAHELAQELTFASGLLPENALWWGNTRSGPVVAIWVEAGIRRLALQVDAAKAPVRYDVPLPGLIFICQPGKAPRVYAATQRPAGPKSRVYKAPLANVYDDGRSCAGSNRYPAEVGAIPDSFFKSFFTRGANLDRRSKTFPEDVTQLWKSLDKKKKFPLDDLIYHGTVADLMAMRIG